MFFLNLRTIKNASVISKLRSQRFFVWTFDYMVVDVYVYLIVSKNDINILVPPENIFCDYGSPLTTFYKILQLLPR